jgi:hypothetical protein
MNEPLDIDSEPTASTAKDTYNQILCVLNTLQLKPDIMFNELDKIIHITQF